MTVLAIGTVTTGVIGFLVVATLAVACVFLFRSMLHHMRKVPPSFDPPPAEQDTAPPSSSSNGQRPSN